MPFMNLAWYVWDGGPAGWVCWSVLPCNECNNRCK